MSNHQYLGLHHVSLLVSDLSRSIDFYLRVLGMEQDHARPDMAFPGIWLNLGGQQIHLINLNKTSTGSAAGHPGRDTHFAISVNDINNIIEVLKRENIAFHLSKSGRNAVFCRDPDGNAIEFIERKFV